MTHGTHYAYNQHGCRCNDCRGWHARYQREYKAKRVIPDIFEHGTLSSYANYRCRCEPCREVNRVYQKAYQERRRRKDGTQVARRRVECECGERLNALGRCESCEAIEARMAS